MNKNFKSYEFDNWTEFKEFIEENKEKVIGKKIDAYYNAYGSYDIFSDEPIVLIIDEMCVFIYYLFLSSITICVFNKEVFEKDITCNFLYKDIEGSQNVYHCLRIDNDFPFLGLTISDITLERFTHEFEINCSTGETRPEGGDYFSVINIHMSNGKKLCICAEDAESDGYVDAWIE